MPTMMIVITMMAMTMLTLTMLTMTLLTMIDNLLDRVQCNGHL